jgi:hypothetical protein
VLVLPVSAVQRVVIAGVTESAVFPGEPCFQVCSQGPDGFLVLAVRYSPAVVQETDGLHLTAVHCFLAAPYFRDEFQQLDVSPVLPHCLPDGLRFQVYCSHQQLAARQSRCCGSH